MGAVSQGGSDTNASGVPKWRRDSGAGTFLSRLSWPGRSVMAPVLPSGTFPRKRGREPVDGQLQCNRQIKRSRAFLHAAPACGPTRPSALLAPSPRKRGTGAGGWSVAVQPTDRVQPGFCSTP
ncbi:Hypothetical Protein XCAW_01874 [Xanthomonas citri subsp. citri Aw12879]|nr:Hypothetical Protein XCAW_01874 [Xanthomonas citri subsp. citri Aw12879]